MTALDRLPNLLHQIDALASGVTLCCRHDCYAEAYRWLSPYCEPDCARDASGQAGRQGGPSLAWNRATELAATDAVFAAMLARHAYALPRYVPPRPHVSAPWTSPQAFSQVTGC